MMFLLSGVFGVGSLATLGLLIGRAPEGYETEKGLRLVRSLGEVKQAARTHLPIAQVLQ